MSFFRFIKNIFFFVILLLAMQNFAFAKTQLYKVSFESGNSYIVKVTDKEIKKLIQSVREAQEGKKSSIKKNKKIVLERIKIFNKLGDKKLNSEKAQATYRAYIQKLSEYLEEDHKEANLRACQTALDSIEKLREMAKSSETYADFAKKLSEN